MSRADAIERACDTFVADGRPHNRTCDCADCQNYDAVAAALALPPDPDQITTDNSATLVNALERVAELEAALWEAPAPPGSGLSAVVQAVGYRNWYEGVRARALVEKQGLARVLNAYVALLAKLEDGP